MSRLLMTNGELYYVQDYDALVSSIASGSKEDQIHFMAGVKWDIEFNESLLSLQDMGLIEKTSYDDENGVNHPYTNEERSADNLADRENIKNAKETYDALLVSLEFSDEDIEKIGTIFNSMMEVSLQNAKERTVN